MIYEMVLAITSNQSCRLQTHLVGPSITIKHLHGGSQRVSELWLEPRAFLYYGGRGCRVFILHRLPACIRISKHDHLNDHMRVTLVFA
jgi:hypothetical protein